MLEDGKASLKLKFRLLITASSGVQDSQIVQYNTYNRMRPSLPDFR